MGDGVNNNTSINLGWKKNWTFNEEQKGINSGAFQTEAPTDAKNKDKKKVDKQNYFNQQLFNRYDTNKDGVLDQDEIKNLRNDIVQTANCRSRGDNAIDAEEMQAFLRHINYDSGEFGSVDRSNLYSFLNTLNEANGTEQDNINSATTKDGVTTVNYSDGHVERYKMTMQDGNAVQDWKQVTRQTDEDGTTITETYDRGELIETKEIKNGLITTKGADGKPKKINNTKTGEETTFEYEATPPRATVKQGKNVVIYGLTSDGSIDKNNVIKTMTFNARTQDYDMQEYVYGEDGVTVSNSADGSVNTYALPAEGAAVDTSHPKKTVTKDGGNTVTMEFEYAEDGTVTKRTKTVTNAAGETVSGPEEVDDKGEPVKQNQTYDVKSSDTWYSIAQEQYGLTKHSEIMEAVHALKDQYKETAGPDGYRKNIGPQKAPDGKLTLPATISVGGRTVAIGGTEVTGGAAEVSADSVTGEDEVVTPPPVQGAGDETVDVHAAQQTQTVAPVQDVATASVQEVDAVSESIPVDAALLTTKIPETVARTIEPAPAECPWEIGDGDFSEFFSIETGEAVRITDDETGEYIGSLMRDDNTFLLISPDKSSGVSLNFDAADQSVLNIVSMDFQGQRADFYDPQGEYALSSIIEKEGYSVYNTEGNLISYTQRNTFNGQPAEYVYGTDGQLQKVVVTEKGENNETTQTIYVPDPANPGSFKEEKTIPENPLFIWPQE